jgi:hypothetical protein
VAINGWLLRWAISVSKESRILLRSGSTETKMKITKQKLKQIIKEELNEAPRYADSDAQDWAAQSSQELYVDLTDEQKDALNNLENAVNQCLDAGVSDSDMKDTIESRIMS